MHGLLAQMPALFRLGAQFKLACMRATTAALFIISVLTGAIQPDLTPECLVVRLCSGLVHRPRLPV